MSKTVLLSLAVMATVAGCAAKDTPASDSAKVAQSGKAAPVAAQASRGSFDPATHTATIYAKDYAFEAPDSISAGLTTFHLVNEGPGLHHVQLVRLDSGKTIADLDAAMKNPGPPPAWAIFIGGPNAPDPSKTSDATFDIKEGNYALLCMVDIPDHIPHAAKGMARPFKVVAAAGTPAVAPTADVSISLADYAFKVTGPLTAGKHTLKIENAGPQPHEVEILRLAPGKTMKDVDAWFESGQKGPPPITPTPGMAGLGRGRTGTFTTTLTPGRYGVACFIPDVKDGKPHEMHGMVQEFTVAPK